MDGFATTDRRRLLTSALANWVAFAAQLAAAFFLSPILVHGLGPDRYGIWSLVESVLAYLMLFDLGVAVSVVRYVARFEATRDQEGLNRVFSTSVCIFTVAGAGVLAVALALAFPAFGLLHVPAELADEGRWMLALLGLNLGVGLPLSVFSCVLDGLGRYPAKSAVRTAGLLLRSVLFLAVVRAGGGLVPLAVAITAYSMLEHLALAVAARHYLPGLRFSLRLVDRATFRTIRGYSVHALLAMVAGRISFQTDAIVIGAFLAPQFITFFMVAGRLVEYAKDSLRVATSVLTPAASALEARGDDAGLRGVLVGSTRYVLWLILPVQLGLMLLGKPFLALWMGPDYAALSYPTLAVLALPLALALSQSASVRILYGIGRLRWFARVVLAEALVNLLLSLALVRPYGIEGVALGTTVPNVVVNVAIALYLCRALGVRPVHYLRRSFLAPCAAAALLAAGWLAAAVWAPPDGWASLSATVAAGLAVYFALAGAVEFGPRAVLRRLRALPGRLARAPRPAPVPLAARGADATPLAIPEKESACASSLTPSKVRCEV
jgi:O-antigen/teichoic acid export membrane protein